LTSFQGCFGLFLALASLLTCLAAATRYTQILILASSNTSTPSSSFSYSHSLREHAAQSQSSKHAQIHNTLSVLSAHSAPFLVVVVYSLLFIKQKKCLCYYITLLQRLIFWLIFIINFEHQLPLSHSLLFFIILHFSSNS
jgi:hypothetical protein